MGFCNMGGNLTTHISKKAARDLAFSSLSSTLLSWDFICIFRMDVKTENGGDT